MNNGCTCQTETCSCGLLERPRYFPRQLISDTEMTLDQEYFRNRLRLHNRMLHGWGVVCGAIVCRVPLESDADRGRCDNGVADCDGYKPWKILVKRGYILGPYGDEIVIGCEHEIDLRTIGVSGVSGESTAHVVDPWCCERTGKRSAGWYWIAVRYKECKTRPVRVQPVGCGCDDTQCEYSRWRDGYEIAIRDECPESHRNPPGRPWDRDAMEPDRPCCIPPCPPCPDDPWVVLARLHVDENGCVDHIDNCSCRRLVVSLAHHWWSCSPEPMEFEKMDAGGVDYLMRDDTGKHVTISGKFPKDATVSFGPGVEVEQYTTRETGLVSMRVNVGKAVPGTRKLRIVDPCGPYIEHDYHIRAPDEHEDPMGPIDPNSRGGGRKKTTRKKTARKKTIRRKTGGRKTAKKGTARKTKRKVTRKKGTARRTVRKKR